MLLWKKEPFLDVYEVINYGERGGGTGFEPAEDELTMQRQESKYVL